MFWGLTSQKRSGFNEAGARGLRKTPRGLLMGPCQTFASMRPEPVGSGKPCHLYITFLKKVHRFNEAGARGLRKTLRV